MTVLSVAVTAGPILAARRLSHDTLWVYPYFFDNFDSLLRFGEPAWWSPEIANGFPTYFYSLLGVTNAGKPAFVAVALGLWALGRLGVTNVDLLAVYVFYFGVVLPALFLLGVWLVARRVLRAGAARLFVLIVAGFSPGVVLNLSDPGMLEYMAYCLFWVAAYLDFVARPGGRSFGIVCLCSGLISLAFSQYALMTALPWLPLVVIGSAVASRAARRALRGVPLWHWAAGALLLVATAAPSLIAYTQVRDELAQSTLEGFEYSFARLKAGNPLEFVLASVPAIGFEWDRYDQYEGALPSEFRAQGLVPGRHLSFNYLGALAIPLAGLGLVYGRRTLRSSLLVMLVLASTVLALPGVSPLFSALLAFPSPLRSMNHYGDLLYRGGGFLLLLFAAGLGLEAALRRREVRRLLPVVLAASSLLALGVWLYFGRPSQGLVGFAAAVAVCLFLVSLDAARRTPRAGARGLAAGVLALTAIDVSTAAFWHVRLTQLAPITGEDAPVYEPGVGFYAQTNTVVISRDMRRMGAEGLPLDQVPPALAFCRAHAYAGLPTHDDFARAFAAPARTRSLALPAASSEDEALLRFLRAPAGECAVRLGLHHDYNTKQATVHASAPALLLFGDAYSKHWRATLDGRPVPVLRALGGFQAVSVPAGASQLELEFHPPFVAPALAVAYLLLVGLAIELGRSRTGAPRAPR